MSLLTDASLILTPNGYNVNKLYSVIPNTTLGDMAVSRGSSATRVNSAGLIEIARTNLVLRSEEFDLNLPWATLLATVTANATTAPDGTVTADKLIAAATSVPPNNHIVLQQPAGSVNGTTVTFSVFAKASDFSRIKFVNNAGGPGVADYILSGTGNYTLGSGVSANIEAYPNGWYRCLMTYIPINTGNYNIQIRLVNNSNTDSFLGDGTSGVFLWGAQLEIGETATEYIPTVASIRTKFAGITQDGGFGANIPRIDYPPLGGCPSILVEPARTNVALYSEEFDNAYWSKSLVTITPNATTAPDNTMTADKFIPDGTTSVHQISTSVASNAYTFSVFAKAGGETTFSMWLLGATVRAEFNLSTGTIIVNTATSANIEPYPNGWYRCSVYSSTAGTTAQIYGRGGGAFAGNGVDGIFLWGAQLEAGSNATSYIPTTTIPLTRTDDIISRTGISILIGQAEGTIFWDVKNLTGSTASGNPDFSIKNTAFTNWIGLTSNTSASPFRVTARAIGLGNIIDYSANITSAKACLKYGTFGAKLFLNGNPTPVATSVVNPNFSFDNILFRGSLFSYKTNSFALWTTALTDDQCKNLTT